MSTSVRAALDWRVRAVCWRTRVTTSARTVVRRRRESAFRAGRADASVTLVVVWSSLATRPGSALVWRLRGVVLSLAARSVDQALRTGDTLRRREQLRVVTPFLESELTATLQSFRKIAALIDILETAVDLAP